ncbi:MAG: TolC family protein [Tannerellaceae bacterium]|nr:TolC family protein [Tannerellaceae bacterium]
MKKRIYTGLLAFLLPLCPVIAQEVLTLDRCREMAVENNKRISISNENKKKAGYDVKGYLANYYPRFSATGNYLYTTTGFNKSIPEMYLPSYVPGEKGTLVPNLLPTPDGSTVFQQYAWFPGLDIDLRLRNTYTAGLMIEQPLYMGGKITAAYKMARIGEEMAGLNQQLTRTEVILLTDEAYWTHVQTMELAKTAYAYKSLLDALLQDVENAWNAGLKPRNDLLKVQVKLNEAGLQVMQAENAVRLSRMNLCHVIGLPLNSAIQVSGDYELDSALSLPAPDITARPEYGILSKQIELKEQQTRLARSEFLPNIGVMGNFGYANGLKLNGERLLDNSSFSALLSVNIPLFHWGEGRNKVRSAKAERNIATLQREEMSEKMELEAMQALNELEESRMEVILTTRSLEQAEENLKVSRDYYDAGLETLADHLEAQTLWQKAASDLVRAKTAVYLNETKYLKAIGTYSLP